MCPNDIPDFQLPQHQWYQQHVMASTFVHWFQMSYRLRQESFPNCDSKSYRVSDEGIEARTTSITPSTDKGI